MRISGGRWSTLRARTATSGVHGSMPCNLPAKWASAGYHGSSGVAGVAGDYQGSRYAGGRDQEETGLAGVSGFGHTTGGRFVGGAAFQYSVLLTGLGTMLCLQAGQPAPAASVVLLVPW